jgi:hypothetical protein
MVAVCTAADGPEERGHSTLPQEAALPDLA